MIVDIILNDFLKLLRTAKILLYNGIFRKNNTEFVSNVNSYKWLNKNKEF